MSSRPFLLITNDDGIHAEGLKHLWRSVQPFADLAIVAPIVEKSGCGVAITYAKPLRAHAVPWEMETPAWSLTGTPADCIKMALSVLLKKRPDMVISGINRGSNSGRTVLYSGTIGGVIEGILKDIPGIAFSFCDETPPPLSATKDYIVPIIQHVLKNPLPRGTFLNVNFPYNTKDGVKGFRIAKQGKSYWVEAPDERIHPEGVPYYWLGGKWRLAEGEDPESDVSLLQQGYIAAVPIHVGHLTDMHAFETHKVLTESLFSQRG